MWSALPRSLCEERSSVCSETKRGSANGKPHWIKTYPLHAVAESRSPNTKGFIPLLTIISSAASRPSLLKMERKIELSCSLQEVGFEVTYLGWARMTCQGGDEHRWRLLFLASSSHRPKPYFKIFTLCPHRSQTRKSLRRNLLKNT